MELVMFWLIFCVVVGVIANSRNRSGFGWFLLSILISPLLGALLVLALGKKQPDAPSQASLRELGVEQSPNVRKAEWDDL